ncbi:MAG: AraC family transcriptional regulator [Psychrosphaera sp.]|nr:AraC family transcriptional regulator [Psychrosphaera sp.]
MPTATTQTGNKAPEGESLPNKHQQFMACFSGFIAEGYADPELDLTIISAQMAMSNRQLQRKLKAMSGTTFGEVLRDYRLNQAYLLLNSGEQIAAIADAVGFASSNYFSRCFKAKYGKTPNDYRKAS